MFLSILLPASHAMGLYKDFGDLHKIHSNKIKAYYVNLTLPQVQPNGVSENVGVVIVP